jgi:small subunit ribosomal protein S7
MPRRAAAQPRRIEPDAVHRNRLVQQVINKVMLDGKKSVAEKIVYDALAILGERTGKNPVEQLEAGVKALTPVLEVRSRRVGGATYQVPVEVRSSRRQALGLRWLIAAARDRNEKTMMERLSAEVLDASNNRGNAVKKREDTHRMAEANRAFSHYRW